MTWTAIDSVGQPDPQAAKDAGYLFVAAYVGTAYQRYGTTRAYIDRVLAVGLGFLPIFEEWASQFLGGYDTATQMMGRMRQGWDGLGLPNDGTCCPAIALVDPDPGRVYGNENALIDFARGVDDACWLPTWTGYASRVGHETVAPHVRKMARRWGVGTWGYGEALNGSLPQTVDADMIQHGNKPAALPGCDENTVFTENMGQLGATTAPVPPREEEDVAYIAVGNAVMGSVAAVVDGGYRVGDFFTGPAGAYGIPQSAIDWNNAGGRDLKYVSFYGDDTRFAHVIAERPSDSGGGGGGGTPNDPSTWSDADVTDQFNKRLASGAIDASVLAHDV